MAISFTPGRQRILLRTSVPHIFAIGDIVGQPVLAHKAMHEDHVAAEVIVGELQGKKELAAVAFNAHDEGVTKLLFDDSPEADGHGKILGGGMVGTHAGDMIGEIALAIEMGADAVDISKTIHPHSTLGESIGMAAEVAHGNCTDVPPAKR